MIKKLLSIAIAVTILFSVTACGAPSKEIADIVIKNGCIYTVDAQATEAAALAIKDDMIVYVGDEGGVNEFIGENTEVVDLNGGMALPGFIDSHGHPAYSANELFMLSLSECTSDLEYVKAIKDHFENYPNSQSIVGYGWDRPVFKNLQPTKEVLDEISENIPIVMADSGFHVRWLNSKALEIMGISKDSNIPEGALVEKDSNGEPTGLVSDYPGIGDVFQKFSVDQFEEAVQYYQEMAHQYGITTTFEDFPRSYIEGIQAYSNLEAKDLLKLRVACYVRANKDDSVKAKVAEIKEFSNVYKEGLFRVKGVKIFIDGVLEGGTAYLNQPYLNNPNSFGVFNWEGNVDKLNQLCAEADANALNLHFHAIGNVAVSAALDAVKYTRDMNGMSDSRPGIAHIQLVNEDDFQRFKDLKVVAVPQPFWAVYDEYYDLAVEFVGKELADQQYPIESFFKKEVVVASGSDYPVQSSRPLTAIENGITRAYAGEPEDTVFLPQESEKATLKQMIESYTINGAYANFLDNEVGSLEVGKKADIVILEKNLFDVKPNEIAQVKEVMTIFNGKVVYKSK